MVGSRCLNQAAVFVKMGEELDLLVPVSQLVEDVGLVVFGTGVSDVSV